MNVPCEKVLVIDDDPAVLASLTDYLADHGYTVQAATNGREGLALFEKDRPDVVLTDLRMPEVDGLEVLRQVGACAPDTPLLVTSGVGHIKDAIEALRLGAWDYFLKPIDDLSLVTMSVQKALAHARLKREHRAYQENLEAQVRERTRQLENELAERRRTEEQLQAKISELARFNRLTVGRELRMLELKQEVNQLCTQLGQPPRYATDLVDMATPAPGQPQA